MSSHNHDPFPKLRISPASIDLLLVLAVPLAIYVIELQAGVVSKIVDAFDAISVFGIFGDELLVILSSLGFLMLFYSMRRQRETTRSELALQRSERRFRALIENSADGIVLLDTTGKVLYRSPANGRILGYPAEASEGNAFALVHPDDLASFQTAVARVLERPGASVEVEYRAQHHDGSWRRLDAVATNLLSEPGVNAIVANFRDITERRQAEEARRASEQRLQTIMDSMLEGFQIISSDWHYLYVNDSYAVHGRQTKEALLGHTPMEVYPWMVRTELGSAMRRSMRERISLRLENQFTFADGSSGWFDLSIQPAPEGIFILSHDISEQKHAQLQIQTQLEQLRALRRIDVAIVGSTDMTLMLGNILEEVIGQLHVDAAAILLLDQATHTLLYRAGRGFRTRLFEGAKVRVGEGFAGVAVLERRMVQIPDINVVPDRAIRAPLALQEGFVSYVGVPLIAKGEVQGVLNVYHRSPLTPNQDWLDFLEGLAGQAAIAVDNAELFAGLQRSNANLSLAYDTTLEGWSRALDLRDHETEGHSLRVMQMTLDLARAMGLGDAELVQVRRGTLLHDIGKMGVPDRILLKPEPLTDDEWVSMRKHPGLAYELLSPIKFLSPALDIPYCHHEKWDGTGYPRGLKGEQIPLTARMFAIVDVWDALRSDRPYRPAWPVEKVLAHIRSLAGTHFDPAVVEAFLKMEN